MRGRRENVKGREIDQTNKHIEKLKHKQSNREIPENNKMSEMKFKWQTDEEMKGKKNIEK